MSVRLADRTTTGPSLSGRLEQVGQLLPPVVRAIRWGPLAGAAAVAFVQVFFQTRETCLPITTCVGNETRVLALRIAALLLAFGAAFVLDDPTEETTAHLPTPRWLRRLVRVGVLAPAIAVIWAVLVPLALRSATGTDPFPARAVALELAGMVVAALVISAAASRFVPEGMGGVAAGPILLGLVAAVVLLPKRLAIFPLEPMGVRWSGAHEVWRLILVAGLVAFLLVSRDPWRRSLASIARRTGQPARRAT